MRRTLRDDRKRVKAKHADAFTACCYGGRYQPDPEEGAGINRMILQKVTACITREGETGRELLFFRHPTAGVQIPAGTVEAGEAVADAVVREAAEETGLAAVQVVRTLAVMRTRLPAPNVAVLHSTPLYRHPADDAPVPAPTIGRGMPVKAGNSENGYTEVIIEEYDLNCTPPHVITRFSGWIPSSFLTAEIERHLFHLICIEPTPETWEPVSDGGRIFRPFWAPLVPRPTIISPQDTWLDLVYRQLIDWEPGS